MTQLEKNELLIKFNKLGTEYSENNEYEQHYYRQLRKLKRIKKQEFIMLSYYINYMIDNIKKEKYEILGEMLDIQRKLEPKAKVQKKNLNQYTQVFSK